jgi:hypothetical protein
VSDDTHFSEIGARHIADRVATELKALRLPISKRVTPHVPALTRDVPVGGPSCA